MRNKECRVTEEPTVAEKEFDSNISYTSSIFSVVEVVNPKDRYVVGDVVRILITARDNKNVTKTHGGDYMRLKLYTEQTQSSWAIDVTNDLGNGTYLADVELRWPVWFRSLLHWFIPTRRYKCSRESDRMTRIGLSSLADMLWRKKHMKTFCAFQEKWRTWVWPLSHIHEFE